MTDVSKLIDRIEGAEHMSLQQEDGRWQACVLIGLTLQERDEILAALKARAALASAK